MPVKKSFTSKFEVAASKLNSKLRHLVSGNSDPSLTVAMQATSPFFRLPGEIRTQIYIEAFGNTTIHLDYVNSTCKHPIPHSLEGVEFNEEGVLWRWQAYRCHRDPKYHFALDGCLAGGKPTVCAEFGTPCFAPAALGWLSSCRRAYSEVLPILYGAEGRNKFHLSKCKLAMHGTKIVGLGLSMIVDLELSWTGTSIVTYATRDLDLYNGWPAYRKLVAALSTTFPSLKRLALHIDGGGRVTAEFEHWQGIELKDDDNLAISGLFPGDTNPDEEDKDMAQGKALLGPVSELVRAFDGQLEETRFILKERCFVRVLTGPEGGLSERLERLERLEQDEKTRTLRAWWPTPPAADPGADGAEPEVGGLGFWVETVAMPCDCAGGEEHQTNCVNRIVWDVPLVL